MLPSINIEIIYFKEIALHLYTYGLGIKIILEITKIINEKRKLVKIKKSNLQKIRNYEHWNIQNGITISYRKSKKEENYSHTNI